MPNVTANWGSAIFTGTYPNFDGGTVNWTPLLVLNDNSVVLVMPHFAQPPGYWDAYVVDVSGAWTYYRSPNGAYSAGLWSMDAAIPLGNGLFFLHVSNGAPYSWWPRFQNLKLNNTAPIIVPPASSPINPGPCTNFIIASYNVYFDSVSKYLAAGLYPNGGAAGPIYASVYSLQGNSFTQLSLGFAGIHNNGASTDPFIQAGVPGGLGASHNLSNGSLAGWQNVSGNNYKAYLGNYAITPGVTNTPPCYPTQTVPNGASVNWRGVPSIQPFVTNSTNLLLDTNVQGFWAEEINGGTLFIDTNTGVQYFLTNNQGNDVLTNAHLFGFHTSTKQIFVSQIPGAMMSTPGALRAASHHTVNNARPVSLTGRYRA